MYEEVCLLCGRPVLADGRAYCSDECESLDVTSPSISTSSSAQPSPFLHSTTNPPIQLSEVPVLLPSALGHSLSARKSHRVRHSISSSSNSSASWSVIEDSLCYDDTSPPVLHGANTDDEFYAVNSDYLSTDAAPKPSPSFGTVLRHPNSSLAYVRRPSTTNHRSMVPTLHHRTSSASTPFTAGMSRSIPFDGAMEDDVSDAPSVPASSSSRPERRKGRGSIDSVGEDDVEADREKEQDTVTGKSRRNRASLPAYFSLLVSSSTTLRSHKGTSALSMLSRSLHSSSSPPTPRLARPIVDTTTAFAPTQYARVPKESTQVVDAASRGRSKRRDPDGRSSSRLSPSRSRPHVHQSAHARARLDSMEKVAEWVAHSPVVTTGARPGRRAVQRRNSSPPPLPKFEQSLCDSGVELDSGYVNSAVEEFVDDDDDELSLSTEDAQRGRRRVEELDEVPVGVERFAPGFGNGRSGLAARERGRTATVKR